MKAVIHRDPAEFAEIRKRFQEETDLEGKPMQEVCERYWRDRG